MEAKPTQKEVLLHQNVHTLGDGAGYSMQIEEMSFNHIGLKWGSYINPEEKMLSFYPDKNAVVSHFRMFDGTKAWPAPMQALKEKQFVVYREGKEEYELLIPPTSGSKPRCFFELQLSEQFFGNMFSEESNFMCRFQLDTKINQPSLGFTAPMLPSMYAIINDMYKAPYSGVLRGMYLEAKAVELFLLQVNQLDSQLQNGHLKLTTADVEALYTVKKHIDANYDKHSSITYLARLAGINQMKLKNGFKKLFNTTVFGYLFELRMQEAKRLLLDEKLPVGQVADCVGYAHPHHFTAAFRKRFGVLPGSFKA